MFSLFPEILIFSFFLPQIWARPSPAGPGMAVLPHGLALLTFKPGLALRASSPVKAQTGNLEAAAVPAKVGAASPTGLAGAAKAVTKQRVEATADSLACAGEWG